MDWYNTTTVKKLREACKLSQPQVGEQLGIARQTISRAETGRAGRKLLKRLAEFYQVEFDLFFRSDDEARPWIAARAGGWVKNGTNAPPERPAAKMSGRNKNC